MTTARIDEYQSGDPYKVEWAPFHAVRRDITLKLAQKCIRTGNRVIDIGCGRGHITDLLRRVLPDCLVIGLDRSREAIRYATEYYPDTGFICTSDFPAEIGEFNLAILGNVIEHIPDPIALLRSIPLVAGGYVIISTPSRFRLANILRAICYRPLAFMSPYHLTEYTPGQVEEILRASGYAVVDIMGSYAGGGHRVIRGIFAVFVPGPCLAETVFAVARRER